MTYRLVSTHLVDTTHIEYRQGEMSTSNHASSEIGLQVVIHEWASCLDDFQTYIR